MFLVPAAALHATARGRRAAILGARLRWPGFLVVAVAATLLAHLVDHEVARASDGLHGLAGAAAIAVALGADARVQAGGIVVALAWAWWVARGTTDAQRAAARRRSIAFVAASIALAALAEEAMELLLSRPRPREFLETGVDEVELLGFRVFGKWGSFPSGHAARSFALAAALWIVLPRGPWARAALVLALLASCAQLGLLRHFVSDLVAGAFLGLAAPSLVAALAAPFAGKRRGEAAGDR